MNSNDLPNRGIPVEDEANHVHGDGLPVDHENMLTVVPVTDEPIEVDDTFSLDKFQVVRREFFSHIYHSGILPDRSIHIFRAIVPGKDQLRTIFKHRGG